MTKKQIPNPKLDDELKNLADSLKMVDADVAALCKQTGFTEAKVVQLLMQRELILINEQLLKIIKKALLN